jgi:hypothetical protein
MMYKLTLQSSTILYVYVCMSGRVLMDGINPYDYGLPRTGEMVLVTSPEYSRFKVSTACCAVSSILLAVMFARGTHAKDH